MHALGEVGVGGGGGGGGSSSGNSSSGSADGGGGRGGRSPLEASPAGAGASSARRSHSPPPSGGDAGVPSAFSGIMLRRRRRGALLLGAAALLLLGSLLLLTGRPGERLLVRVNPVAPSRRAAEDPMVGGGTAVGADLRPAATPAATAATSARLTTGRDHRNGGAAAEADRLKQQGRRGQHGGAEGEDAAVREQTEAQAQAQAQQGQGQAQPAVRGTGTTASTADAFSAAAAARARLLTAVTPGGGGGGALQQARDALARHTGGGIPRIIHQMYGLFDFREKSEEGAGDAASAAGIGGGGDGASGLVGSGGGRRLRRRALQGLPDGPEASVRSWRERNPDYTHVLWGSRDIDRMVKIMFPAFAPAFRAFARLPVLRADLARYLVVFAFGGVYADTDTSCLRPVEGWADGQANVSAIVGIEADAGRIANWHLHWGRQLQFCQWTFAAEPAHPLLAHVVFRISQLLESKPPEQLTVHDVVHVTGPSVMSDAVYDYMRSQGRNWTEFEGLTRGSLVGDLLVLPITAFSPGVGHMGARPVWDPEARVQHHFSGSWRKQGVADGGQGAVGGGRRLRAAREARARALQGWM